jgi:hypothetical protein
MRSMKDAMAPKTVAATTRAEVPRLLPSHPTMARSLTVLALVWHPKSEHHQRRFRRQTILQAVS